MFTRRLDMNGLLNEGRSNPPAATVPQPGPGPEDL
jgi:hypothetical protein